MQHLDEGTLQALLDGELSATDTSQAEKHLALCAACRRIFAEAKGIFTESDRLVGLLEPGSAAAAAATAEERTPEGAVPRELRRRRYRQLAWAASLVLAAGLGYLASVRHYAGRRSGADIAARAVTSSAAPAAPTTENSSPPTPAVAEHSAAPPPAAARPLAGTSMKSAAPSPASDAVRRETPRSQPRDQAAAPKAPAPAVPLAESRAREQAAPGSGDVITGDRAMGGLSPGRASAGNAAEPPRTLTRGFRRISMEEAVRMLSGSIHLIDGMAPEWVEAGPGRFVAGAFPDAELIRVVYQDAPGREIWLDQQRLPHPISLPPGDTAISTTSSGGLRITWQPEPAFRVSICARVPADSLRVLARHVH